MCKYCENLTIRKCYGEPMDGYNRDYFFAGRDIAAIELAPAWGVKGAKQPVSFVAISEPNKLLLGYNSEEEGFWYFAERQINYCPMCGRKLN